MSMCLCVCARVRVCGRHVATTLGEPSWWLFTPSDWASVQFNLISFIFKSDWGPSRPDPYDARPLPASRCGKLYQDPFSQPLMFGRRGTLHLPFRDFSNFCNPSFFRDFSNFGAPNFMSFSKFEALLFTILKFSVHFSRIFTITPIFFSIFLLLCAWFFRSFSISVQFCFFEFVYSIRSFVRTLFIFKAPNYVLALTAPSPTCYEGTCVPWVAFAALPALAWP